MPADLTSEELAQFAQQLRDREAQLRSELLAGQARASRETFERLAGEAPDRGDSSVAQTTADIVSAERQRDSDELVEVLAALERIEAGTYGICMACGEPIGVERLRALPTARYDIRHEEANERRRGGVATPRL
jgi:RNA polymerase-binding transcription factor